MIIFGIDPGTATTGYGVIKNQKSTRPRPSRDEVGKIKNKIELIDYGCIVTSKDKDMPVRLYLIQKELKSLLKQHNPDCIIVEQLFFGANSRTAMSVGQARGVVLSAASSYFESSRNKLSYRVPIFEYQGLHVKHTLTGSGKSDKKQIQKSVMKYLGKRKLKKPANGYLDDAADALAVAICHAIKVAKG